MKRQAGITLVGFIIVLIVVAFFGYTAMKLVPAYMDYFSVSKALAHVASDANSSAGGISLEEIHRKLDTQELSQYFDDADINPGNLHVINDPKLGQQLQLKYEKQVPWLYNIYFLLKFQKTVQLKAALQQG